jgi:hypothetical protein
MFTVEQLFAFAIAGSVVSLLLEYFPKLNAWYGGQPDNVQRLIILGSGAVVVLGAFGLNCLDFFVDLPWACSLLGVKEVLASYLAFVFASQGTYLVSPKS